MPKKIIRKAATRACSTLPLLGACLVSREGMTLE